MFRPRTLPSAARSRPTHARRTIIPRVDGLEPRLLLAKAPALVQIVETPDGGGSSSVQVIGTSKNDVIFITDDGKRAAGSLRITANGITQFTSTSPVTNLLVTTGAGKDQVSYNLAAGGLTAGPAQTIFVSSGSFSTGGAKVKGGGRLQVTANLAGPSAENSTLNLFVAPDKTAATSLTVDQAGAIDGDLGVGITSFSASNNFRAGPTTFRMTSTGAIGKNGAIRTGLAGGANRNLMDVNYSGTNNGDISVTGIGRGAKDVFSATIAMNAGSTGTVGGSSPTQIIANGKTARATLLIARGTDTTSTAGITAQLSTTSRKSVTIHTANVMTLSAGKDTVIA